MRRHSPAGTRVHGDLPDVNVWLALAVQEHTHHAAALAYWQAEAAERVWYCRVTMLGLVRLLTQARIMGAAAMDAAAALAVYERFAALPEVGLCAEPAECGTELHRLARPALPGRLLTDAYLAAFATSAGLRLVTFDRDFDRFDGLDCLRLDPHTSGG